MSDLIFNAVSLSQDQCEEWIQ